MIDQLLSVSLSLNVAGRIQDNLWLTWTQVCQAFLDSAQRVSDTKDGMLICFAHFVNDYKITSLVGNIFAVCLDFDHATTEQLNASIALAKRISTRGIVHTTWQDAPETEYSQAIGKREVRRFRVIIPLDQPVSAAQWADTWQTFVSAFLCHAGAEADGQCKNANRRYYVPVARKGPASNISPFDATLLLPTLVTWGE